MLGHCYHCRQACRWLPRKEVHRGGRGVFLPLRLSRRLAHAPPPFAQRRPCTPSQACARSQPSTPLHHKQKEENLTALVCVCLARCLAHGRRLEEVCPALSRALPSTLRTHRNALWLRLRLSPGTLHRTQEEGLLPICFLSSAFAHGDAPHPSYPPSSRLLTQAPDSTDNGITQALIHTHTHTHPSPHRK